MGSEGRHSHLHAANTPPGLTERSEAQVMAGESRGAAVLLLPGQGAEHRKVLLKSKPCGWGLAGSGARLLLPAQGL